MKWADDCAFLGGLGQADWHVEPWKDGMGTCLRDHFLRTWMGRADVQLGSWGLSLCLVVACWTFLEAGWGGGQVPGLLALEGWWGLGCDGKQVNPGVVD